jgi:regulator of sirC expression with transglutaminase-like and TPR domain
MELRDSELKALVSLLDDDDSEVVTMVESKIKSLGGNIIPYLEDRWEESSLSPVIQRKLEDLIHDLQFNSFEKRVVEWYDTGAQDILKGMWAIATYQYPELSLEKLEADINALYLDAWTELRDDMHPMDQIKALNHVFFSKHKFGANTKHFHSASNSMINVVLDSHRGNPISLCVIYMLVAQKLKLPIYGVNLPNLFILTYKTEKVQFYINVFNRGLVFSKTDIDNYLQQLNIGQEEIFYQPCENIDIIRRVLRNLIIAFEKIGDTEKVKELDAILMQLIA